MNQKKLIALTFDDGPSPVTTPKVLDSLEKAGAKATFFHVGKKIAGCEPLLRRIVANDCQIGCHMWDHENIRKLDSNNLRCKLRNTMDAIEDACGIRPIIMRPPGGLWNEESVKILKEEGLPAILWSVDPQDWKTLNTESTVNHILENIQDGDIILMHDIYNESACAAEILIPELMDRGFVLVTISELASIRGGLEPGKFYRHFLSTEAAFNEDKPC